MASDPRLGTWRRLFATHTSATVTVLGTQPNGWYLLEYRPSGKQTSISPDAIDQYIKHGVWVRIFPEELSVTYGL